MGKYVFYLNTEEVPVVEKEQVAVPLSAEAFVRYEQKAQELRILEGIRRGE